MSNLDKSNQVEIEFKKKRVIGLDPIPDNLLPKFLPPGWKRQQIGKATPLVYSGTKGLKVLVSCLLEEDKEFWLHVSVSHPKRLPTYEELKTVKRIFIGDDRVALQVFPKASEHVNVHVYCLHLWCCASNDRRIPDFTRGLGEI